MLQNPHMEKKNQGQAFNHGVDQYLHQNNMHQRADLSSLEISITAFIFFWK